MSENETEAEYDDSPTSLHRRWAEEIQLAEDNLAKWRERGGHVVKVYRDDRDSEKTRLNLFWADTNQVMSSLYGVRPKVKATRRFSDFEDDQARVAAEMLQRILNADVERDDDTFAEALACCVEDKLLPGLGVMRLRYVAEFGQEEVAPIVGPDGVELAPGYTKEVKVREDVESEYIHWRDFLWSPARTWRDVRWVAFKNLMGREQLESRFGEELGSQIPLTENGEAEARDEDREETPFDRCGVWEIWCKEERKVYWWTPSFPQILDVKPDPLGLRGFFPCPRPLISNPTTTAFVPVPNYCMAQDIYEEIDGVSTRITDLEQAISVSGAYDASSPELKEILGGPEAYGNRLIPVQNWSLFKEKGGFESVMAFLPLKEVVAALDKLREYRVELYRLLQQVTGMSDIMRGQASEQATATEQSIKARFASLRMKAEQDRIAEFATAAQRIKAEIISKHFDAQTILMRSNIMRTPDARLGPQAAQLIKSNFADYRIDVDSDQISVANLTAMQQERTQVVQAFAQYVQSMIPAAQAMPDAMPLFFQIMQWFLAAFSGSGSSEGMFDQAIQATVRRMQAAQQQAAQRGPPPDPKLQAAQVKAQADQQRIGMELKADLTRTQAETQAEVMKQAAQARFNAQEENQRAAIQARMKALDAILKPATPPGGGVA